MFLSLIRNRRSIRRYEQRPVEDEKLKILLEAVLRSPSSMGNNPWEFIVVTDPSVIEDLSRSKPHGATFLKNAPLCIVVCADPRQEHGLDRRCIDCLRFSPSCGGVHRARELLDTDPGPDAQRRHLRGSLHFGNIRDPTESQGRGYHCHRPSS